MQHRHDFPNGLTLVAEPMPHVQSAAMSLLIPAGAATEPANQLGVAAVASEMICRGAGERDARAHSEALDQLGVERSTAVHGNTFRVSANMLGRNVHDALPLLTDMVLKPRFDADQFEPSIDLALQAIEAIEDDPQQKVMEALAAQHLADPFGRSSYGSIEGLETLTLGDLKTFWKNQAVAGNAILSFAGQIDWPRLVEQVGQLIEGWGGRVDEPDQIAPPPRGYQHLPHDTSQVHLGLAYDAIPEIDEDSMTLRAAMAIMSGGASSRLFDEVREKRGLCYSVFASYMGRKDLGMILAYAGTTPERAQETLDVTKAELFRLSQGVSEAEFHRAIVGMKSRLVMAGESTTARAGGMATDIYIYGQTRTIDDILARVQAVTLDKVNQFVAIYPFEPETITSIGPAPLNTLLPRIDTE